MGLGRVRDWATRQPERAWRPLEDIELGPAVPDPGAIYTIGLNYAAPGEAARRRPGAAAGLRRRLPTAVAGMAPIVAWDRALTAERRSPSASSGW